MDQLDDLAFVTRVDPKGMYALTTGFPEQCEQALSLTRSSVLPEGIKPAAVVLAGMGGSAAGGDLVKALFDAFASVPFLVVRDYTLPSWVNSDTLVVCSSYSGNTEETLSAFEDARSRGCPIVCITSGGKLKTLAAEAGLPTVVIPAGQPPRTALGFMMIPVLECMVRLGLLPPQDYESCFQVLRESVSAWGVTCPATDNPAKRMAVGLHGTVPILYGLGSWQGAVAGRWKGQICENAKVLAFAHTFPELNHNEVLGWVLAQRQSVGQWSLVVLEDGTETAKMQKRAEVTMQLTADRSVQFRAQGMGAALLERILSLVLLGDFVSLYMAALNEVDPENIDWLNFLKGELAKVN